MSLSTLNNNKLIEFIKSKSIRVHDIEIELEKIFSDIKEIRTIWINKDNKKNRLCITVIFNNNDGKDLIAIGQNPARDDTSPNANFKFIIETIKNSYKNIKIRSITIINLWSKCDNKTEFDFMNDSEDNKKLNILFIRYLLINYIEDIFNIILFFGQHFAKKSSKLWLDNYKNIIDILCLIYIYNSNCIKYYNEVGEKLCISLKKSNEVCIFPCYITTRNNNIIGELQDYNITTYYKYNKILLELIFIIWKRNI